MNQDKSITKGNGTTTCQHPSAESLGVNNGMAFLRCRTCRSVIVTQGGISLVIPPVPAAG
jgi:hypothetical protein